jgi:hypothetical protein
LTCIKLEESSDVKGTFSLVYESDIINERDKEVDYDMRLVLSEGSNEKFLTIFFSP